jgi:inner membrane transporter RhtA
MTMPDIDHSDAAALFATIGDPAAPGFVVPSEAPGPPSSGSTSPQIARPRTNSGTTDDETSSTRTSSASAPKSRKALATAVLTMLGTGTSSQVGAALGAQAFGAIGPAGVVAVRQLVAAAVLLPVARPPLHRFTWRQWWPTLLLGVVFAVMNLSLYLAVDRIGLGLAVTLEVLGPLAVALAGSRTRLDALCALAAGVGVVVLVLPGPTSDYLGVAFGLLAAAGWASYILLNRLVGARLPGLQAPAGAAFVSVLIYLPVLVVLLAQDRFTAAALFYAGCAGLLCSVVPYTLDLIMLRRVPAQFFGVFMSVNPVLAALAGLVILDQVLTPREWAGIAIVIAANAVATSGVSVRAPKIKESQG